jgi:long-chain acyl-CoA synthetase
MGEMNLADLLTETAAAAPNKTALINGSDGSKVTFGEIDREADRVAGALAAVGIDPGDRVAIAMHNCPEFVYSYFGILRAGAAVVPLNTMLTAAETAAIVGDAEARAVFAAGPFEAVAREAVADVDSVQNIFTAERWSALPNGKPRQVSVGGDDLAVLAYTSGTTGEPKGVMLSHDNLLANLRQQMSIPEARVTEDDVLFLALPLFHIFGLNVTLGLLVMNGASGLLVERFEPVPALRAIVEHKVTVLFGAPTMYGAWVSVPGADQYDLSKVRLAVSGAAPLGTDVLRAFYDLFGVRVYEGYGLTETAPTLWSNRMADKPRPGSVGKALPEVEFRLIDEAGSDVELGDPGEVVVKGPNVFKGYWKRPEETEKAFIDGWFRTGDVGVLDEEGFLYLVDRKRDLIIVSGFNVFPSEVENVLLLNPKVAEAAVVGVPHAYTGEAVKAYVVLEPGQEATEAELVADVQSRLARFKCPSSIEVAEDLPHLLTGKVLRRALRT